MAGPTQEERRAAPYVTLMRNGAVAGMTLTPTGRNSLLLSSACWQGLVSSVLATPFFGVMRLAERLAERTQKSQPLQQRQAETQTTPYYGAGSWSMFSSQLLYEDLDRVNLRVNDKLLGDVEARRDRREGSEFIELV